MATVALDDPEWLAPPRDFALAWHDESAARDRALTLWLPVPSSPGCARRLLAARRSLAACVTFCRASCSRCCRAMQSAALPAASCVQGRHPGWRTGWQRAGWVIAAVGAGTSPDLEPAAGMWPWGLSPPLRAPGPSPTRMLCAASGACGCSHCSGRVLQQHLRDSSDVHGHLD